MLSKNVETAQASANELRRLLTSTHPDSQSVYCKSISDCPVMMEELNAFCDRQVPCLLWRGKAAYATLYIFLATRFLSAPDSVLDCEGTHALWKWVELFKRGISLKLLNAVLKLQGFLRSYGDFPPFSELFPHIEETRAVMKQQVIGVIQNSPDGMSDGAASGVV